MADPVSRLVNLAMLLASSAGPVSRERIADEVEGYPADQDEAAFLRMFERDKDELRQAGYAIESTPEGEYRLDRNSTFAAAVDLPPADAAVLRAVGVAMLADPSFPFAENLRLALAKIASAAQSEDVPVSSRLADEAPEQQGALVASLDRAITVRKQISFDYRNSLGEEKRHSVEPYGIFATDGRWYLAARDSAIDEVRVYAVARMSAVRVNTLRPGEHDYERPEGFDIASFIGLPFQYGKAEPFEARLRFDAEAAWRAPRVAGGIGALEPLADGSAVWSVQARDRRRLLRWVVENGPGIRIEEPTDLLGELDTALSRVVALHG